MSKFGFAKIVREKVVVPAIMQGDRIIPLGDLVAEVPTEAALFANWDAWVDRVEKAIDDHVASSDSWLSADDVEFSIPGIERPSIYGAGANYRDHVLEMGKEVPDEAYHYISPAGTLNYHRGAVIVPAGITTLDWEVELVVVIGRAGKNIRREDALSHVAGYTVGNDFSSRGLQNRHPIFGMDWMKAKNREGWNPVGPSIVPAKFIPDPSNLALSLSVNGVMRQDSTTAQFIVDIPRQIEALSSYITLNPGDLILTGTPSGTAIASGQYLSDGDVTVASVQVIGQLINTVTFTA